MRLDGLDLGTAAIRAAQYVRMSTEHQQYSIENQCRAIAHYAAAHSMQIIRTYSDEGRSGVTIQRREGLRQLIHDVESGEPGFSTVLVYDVSRWGRFQDADESAYYEYRCRRAKIDVHYCTEPFSNDGSITSALLKAIKRAMAGEYSRELSAKVFAGKCRLIELGFRQGGHAGYGLRRLLKDQEGRERGLLKPGERKSIQTDRVVLVPGPDEEVQIVQEIYRRFIDDHWNTCEIARDLNARGLPTEHGREWTRSVVRDILTNPKYCGVNIFNRVSAKLSQGHVRNPPGLWVRRDGAFEPIVGIETYLRAQEEYLIRKKRYSDDELLEILRGVLKRHGRLCAAVLGRRVGTPSRSIYTERFGGLLEAYERIGYRPHNDFSYRQINESLRVRRQAALSQLIDDLKQSGAFVRHIPGGELIVNEEFTIGFKLIRCRHTKHRGERWFLYLKGSLPDITVAARMGPDNESILDYFLLPRCHGLPGYIDIGLNSSNLALWLHRFESLTFLLGLARPIRLKEAI